MSITINDFLKKYNLVDKQLSSYDNDTIRTITKVINGKIDDYVNSKNGNVLLYFGLYHEYVKKEDNSHAMNNFGLLCKDQHKLDVAEKYYLMSAKYSNAYAMNNLGQLYEKQRKLDSAEKYFLMAIDYGNADAMNNMGYLYWRRNRLDLAEKYFLMGINYGNTKAIHSLGFLYEMQRKLDLSEKYYLMDIENNNNPETMCFLGNLYGQQRKFDLAIKYYRRATLLNTKFLSCVVTIIPKISHESQLEILELVPQIRISDEHLAEISETVRTLFANKQMEMSRCLSNYLIDDLVNICLDYF